VRRYVAAPFDGKLEKAVAKVGDTVTAGQALALFDRRPLEMELATQLAELDEAAKRRDAARAKGQAAQAQLAGLELAQIQSKVDQLERQLAELTVASPIHGVIVRGQLDRVEGAPLARGQNLFEVAPLSPLVAELAIPEEEVGLVKRGQAVAVRPLATGHKLRGHIARIHPRAEVVGGQTVFIAEVEIDNVQGQLRPGMQAKAVVYGPRRPLAYTLLRRPTARLARWTWW
jgi:multidrug efflux pump subunit AcrA (membrane-fusion protein)